MRSLSLPTILRRLVLALGVLFTGSTEAGGIMIPCNQPFVFRGASVNVVVLPFAATGSMAAHRRTGMMMSYLIQQNTLRSILDLGSVGAIQLVDATHEPCTVDSVLERLQAPPSATLVPGKGVIVIWGRLYEEGDQVFVQSFARYVVRGRDEGLAAEVQGAHFFAPVSAQTVAFAPVKIERADLDRIVEEYRRAST